MAVLLEVVPSCVAGELACPPEECEGAEGYREFVALVQPPPGGGAEEGEARAEVTEEEKEERTEWLEWARERVSETSVALTCTRAPGMAETQGEGIWAWDEEAFAPGEVIAPSRALGEGGGRVLLRARWSQGRAARGAVRVLTLCGGGR